MKVSNFFFGGYSSITIREITLFSTVEVVNEFTTTDRQVLSPTGRDMGQAAHFTALVEDFILRIRVPNNKAPTDKASVPGGATQGGRRHFSVPNKPVDEVREAK